MKFNLTLLKKNQTVLLHILAWTILFSLPFIFAIQTEESAPRSVHERQFLYLNTITEGFWVLLFYLNTGILIPKLLYQRKLMLFVLAQLLLFAVIISIQRLFFGMLLTDLSFVLYKSSFYNSFPFLFTVLGSIAFKTVSDRIKMDRIAGEKQRENLKTELSFLRSQVSPHFLFNMLNNLVALVRMKSDDLEPTIIKLSSLMQYMLYETDEEKVLLKSEVDYLQNYIGLQKLRFGNRMTVNMDLKLIENWHAIEPMLLIPFVENAFKHGSGMVENPVIDISLKVVKNELFFVVNNKYIDEDKAKDVGAFVWQRSKP
jgi:two-component system LytT family sensor kinase